MSRESGSPDDAFSLLPEEFKQMVESVDVARKCVGKVTYGGVASEKSTRRLRRSLFVVQDVKEGEVFTGENLKSIRPGGGLHTQYYEELLGKKARRNIERGTPMDWSLVE
jgi:pseudaminic acid synthase